MVKLIVGLGNPGKKFDGTRHNIGIEAVRAWANSQVGFSDWKKEESWPAEVGQVRSEYGVVWLLFPLTFMNESGVAVAKFMQKKGIEVSEVVIVQDELELPLGEVKWKEGGSAVGHNGVKSVQEKVGSQEMRRLRLGVGRPQDSVPVERFVLQEFLPEEGEVVERMMQRAAVDLSGLLLPPV